MQFEIKKDERILSWKVSGKLWKFMQQIFDYYTKDYPDREHWVVQALHEEMDLDNSESELQFFPWECEAWMKVFEHHKINSFFDEWHEENNKLQLMYIQMKEGLLIFSELNG